MDINSLNSIASNIRWVDDSVGKIDITPVLEYAVKRHNDMVAMLHEVYEFVEKNFDLFENPKGGWNPKSRNKEYYTNYQIGNENKYNCVLRDFHHEQYVNGGSRIYWVDGGIIFRWNSKLNCVTYLSNVDSPSYHGYDPNKKLWNDSYDFTKFNRGIGFSLGNKDILYSDEPVDWEKNIWKLDDFLKGGWNEFTIAQLKSDVDKDFEHAEKVVEGLVYSLKKINESVIARQTLVNSTLDNSITAKMTSYTIKISKIEE